MLQDGVLSGAISEALEPVQHLEKETHRHVKSQDATRGSWPYCSGTNCQFPLKQFRGVGNCETGEENPHLVRIACSALPSLAKSHSA